MILQKGQYLGFPHSFTVRRKYILNCNGFEEQFTIENRSDKAMPVMLAFHTTFNTPFMPNGKCCVKLAVKREQLRNSNYLPTHEYVSGRKREEELNEGSHNPQQKLSALYEIGGSELAIKDENNKMAVIYTADKEYAYRMLWPAGENFFVLNRKLVQ